MPFFGAFLSPPVGAGAPIVVVCVVCLLMRISTLDETRNPTSVETTQQQTYSKRTAASRRRASTRRAAQVKFHDESLLKTSAGCVVFINPA